MKRQALLLSLIILVTLFLHFTPLATTHASFTDSVSIDGSIKLQTGTLGISAASEPEINLSNETNSDLAIKVNNTGSLNGKITVRSIEGIVNGAQLENLAEYLEIIQESSNDNFIDSQKGMELNFKLIKKEKFKEINEMKLIFLIRISQRNLESDDIGFRDEQTLEVKIINNSDDSSGNGSGGDTGDNNGGGSDNGNDNNLPEKDWPSDTDFNHKEYYLKENLYYSEVEGKLTTISPGILYLKVEKDLKQEEINKRIDYLKSNDFLHEESNKKLTILEVKYVVNKGFILTIGTNEKYSATTSWLGFGSKWSSYFGYIGINEFGLPFLQSSDLLAVKSQLGKSPLIYTSKSGTNLIMKTPKWNNNLWGETVELPLKEKIAKNFEISFKGEDAEYFTFEFVSDTQFRITQKGDEAGKKAVLTFKDKTGKTIYQKKVESVAHYEKSGIEGLNNAFDIVTEKLILTKENDCYQGTTFIYIHLPLDYLSNNMIANINIAGEGYTVGSMAYSEDAQQMRIEVHYSSKTNPWYKEIQFYFYNYYSKEVKIVYNQENVVIKESNFTEEALVLTESATEIIEQSFSENQESSVSESVELEDSTVRLESTELVSTTEPVEVVESQDVTEPPEQEGGTERIEPPEEIINQEEP